MPIAVHVRSENSTDTGFVAAPERVKIDTSFSHSDKGRGALRWVGVANGRYERKHPVLNERGDQVGVLVNGVSELGYTYRCVYSDLARRFAVSHVTFGAARAGKDSVSCISAVDDTGPVLFGAGRRKFRRTKSLTFPRDWVGSEDIFRILGDGRQLLVASAFGFCIVNLDSFETDVKTLYGFEYKINYSGCAVSPNSRLIAAAFCVHDYTDPISGDEKYRNFVRVYDLVRGTLYAEHPIEVDHYLYENWQVVFDKTGHRFQFSSGTERFGFVLETAKD